MSMSLLLAACQAPARTAFVQGPVSAPAAKPVERPPERVQPARWSFRETQASCVASLSNPQISVTVTAGPAHELSISVVAKPRPGTSFDQASVAFRGRHAWRLAAHLSGTTLEASFPAGAQGLDDLLALLGGGQLSARTAVVVLPDLIVPDAGVAGRDWYGCAARAVGEES
jgi:hypothetical protein